MALSPRRRRPLIPALIALIALGIGAEVWYSRQAASPDSLPPDAPANSVSANAAVFITPIPEPSVSIAPRIPQSLVHSPGVTPANGNSMSGLNTKQAQFAPVDEAAALEIDKVSLMLRDYRTIAGENPVGTNAEIMAAIMGGNAKQATLGPPEGMSLNENGELLDRWGTPYFFHQISRDHMEIRSAGPDKVLWNEDDVIVR